MSILRKTRLTSLLNGDMKKLSLFMMAELALITLGMTIALQFDQWKDLENKRESEQILLQQIYQEFLEADSTINFSYKTYTNRIPAIEKIYRNCGHNADDITTKEFMKLSWDMYTYNKLDINNGILIEAINSGKLSLIQNDLLRNKLSSWLELTEHVEYFEENAKDQIFDYYNYSFQFTTYRVLDASASAALRLGHSKMELDISVILNDRIFENQVGWISYNSERMLGLYEEFLITPCKEIVSLIEAELNN
jgi:hypothetical protein